MPEFLRRLSILVAISMLALAPLGCAPSDPASRVAAARGDYEAQLSGWLVRPRETEPEDYVPSEEGEAAEGEGDEGAGMDDEGAGMDDETADMASDEADSRSQVVLFDVIILYSGTDPLPGITVDISHRGADDVEKTARRFYLEIPSIRQGATEQVAFELDGWDLGDADSFSVEIRQGVPAAERGDYREFQEAGG